MSERLRLLIVDDEPLARLRLRSLLADCSSPPVEVMGEAGSAAEALHLLARQPADVLLLDIHMPGLGGLDLARRLRHQPQAPAVVFVTAHTEHALEAFEIEAVDYLTKPVRRQRLQEALQRVAMRRSRLEQLAQIVAPPLSAAVREEPVLVVSDRGRVMRIPVSEIVYLRAEQKYVNLRTTQTHLVLDDALADLEQRLGDAVLRIHRNALVARLAVRALEKRVLGDADSEDGGGGETWAVQVAPFGDWLAVSRRQLSMVREVLAAEGL